MPEVAEPTRTEVLKEVLGQQAKAAEQVKAEEVPDPFKGGEPSFEEFSDYRNTGEIPERFKEAPAEAKAEETAAGKEPVKTEQEQREKKVDFTAEQQAVFDREFRKREAKIRREFEAKYATQTSVPQPTAGEKPTPVAESGEPQRPEPPKLSTFQGTVQEYEKALEEYPAKLQAFLDAQYEHQSKRQTLEKKLSSSESKANKTHPDYKEEFQALADDIRNNDEPKLPNHVLKAIAEEAEDPHELTYYLAKNREEFRRFAELSPAQAMREVVRLDIKLASEPAPQVNQPKPKPKPPEPVTTRASSSAFNVNDESLDADEWSRQRNEDLAKRGRH